MNARIALMTASALVMLALGGIHLVYTYWGPKLLPRDPALVEEMKAVPLVITKQTTVWRAWIGFNASHSIAALLFGLVFGYLALARPEVLFGSWFLLGLGFATLLAFAVLAWAYWFTVPLIGVCLSLLCYVASVAAGRS